MGGKLYDRLKRMKADASKAVPHHAGSKPKPPTPDSEWRDSGEFLSFRETGYRVDFPESIEASPFCLPSLAMALRKNGGTSPGWEGQASLIDRERLVFMDIETTGLSTGAGTIAFSFGAGRFVSGGGDGENFRVEQIFLSDYPGEAEFIEAMAARIPEEAVLVSYNGAAFDLGVLRTRCIMCGRRFPERAHVDLLRTARRLWARPHGGASLSLMEDRVLNEPREGDIPGSEAPERYFDFLRTQDFSRIAPILDHHRLDILALPRLMARASAVFQAPEAAQGLDSVRLALCLTALGKAAGKSILEAEARRGNHEAIRILGILYKREGRIEEAIELWKSALTGRGGHAELYCLAELAKAYEHRKNDAGQARLYTLRALDLDLMRSERENFERRLQRLENRLGKKA
jgi:uncharacterized protein YprB with RNaseH-like and TPR domain